MQMVSRSSHFGGVSVAAAVAVSVALVTGTTPSASADPADWHRYVEGSQSDKVTPQAIVSTSGDVKNGQGLIRGGDVTLTKSADGPDPVVVLDYGIDVAGVPYFDVSAATGTPTLSASYSEGQQFIGPDGDEQSTTFFPRPGVDPKRVDNYQVAGKGMIDNNTVQGGERYECLRLTTPGSVTLRAVGIRSTGFRADKDAYQGWFLSSDEQLNKIWYAGAYTAQLNMLPVGAPDAGPQPVLLDGAKRDRLLWLGDLAQTAPTVAVSLGRNGADYIKQTLAMFGNNQITTQPSAQPAAAAKTQNSTDAAAAPPSVVGAVPGFATPTGYTSFYSVSYSMYYVLCLATYLRYTGDNEFASDQYAVVQKELEFNKSLVDSSTGLLTLPDQVGHDWDPTDGSKTGAVTEFNAIYYEALLDAAFLAEATGHASDASGYRQQAAQLRDSINTHLFNASTGVYDISDTKRGSIAQDANAIALLFGVAPDDKVDGVLQALRSKLWTSHGALAFSPDSGYGAIISPFVGGFEAQARFAVGNASDALSLIRTEWGQMVMPGPGYTGAVWENLQADGTVGGGGVSLAHGWSSGPTSALTNYVLGVRPIGSGFSTWRIEPHTGDVEWARGEVPTPHGPIKIQWKHEGARFILEITAPAGTSGTVALPGLGAAPIQVDGKAANASKAQDRTVPEIADIGAGTHTIVVG